MNPTNPPERCRIVLVAPSYADEDKMKQALSGGDVASVILPQYDLDEQAFQARAEAFAEIVHDCGAAFIVSGDTRTAGRVKADGIHIDAKPGEVAELVSKMNGRMIVGCGGMKNRHEALEAGEAGPDYLFFGKFGYDKKPEAHPRNLALGGWWAEMVEIPGIVMAGSAIDSIETVAVTGTDFVAVSELVFGAGQDPKRQVEAINELLDETAPYFKE